MIAQNSAPERDTPSVIPSQETKAAGVQRNQMVITLKPNEAAEIKLDMRKDAQVSYQWTSSGPVNVDAHGDPTNAPKGFYHGYGKDRQITAKEGLSVRLSTESMAGSGATVARRASRSVWIPTAST